MGYDKPVIQAIVTDYERFILQSSDLDHQGLYLKDNIVFAIIPNIKEEEKKLIIERYDKIRMAGSPPPIFSASIDESKAERLSLSNSWQKVYLHSHPFTHTEASNELNIHLPKKYRPFNFDYKLATCIFKLKLRFKPSEEEYLELEIILANLGYDQYKLEITVDEAIPDYPCNTFKEKIGKLPNPHNLMLSARAFLPKEYPKELLNKYEEDEDFWVDNKLQVFTDPNFSQSEFIPQSFLGTCTCFIDASIFPRQNIREYLALYRTIIIALPFNDNSKLAIDFYKMFSLTTFELKELILRGRLKFVVTQNLKRYSIELLTTIINVDPNSIILSRTLASSTIIGMRNSSGLLGHTLTTDEQFHFIRALSKSNSKVLHRLAGSLGSTWESMEYLVNKMGSAAIAHIGMGQLLGNLNGQPNQASFLGLFAQSYEFSQGLGAHYFPYDDINIPHEIKAIEHISACYSGVQKNTSEIREAELGMLLSKVFSINNDMNVLELDRVFSGKEIPFASELLLEFSNLSKGELELKLVLLRQEIGKIESNKNRLSKWNMTGLIGGGATLIAQEPIVSLLVWAMTCTGSFITNSDINADIFHKLAAINNQTSKDVVLIKRARDKASMIVS